MVLNAGAVVAGYTIEAVDRVLAAWARCTGPATRRCRAATRSRCCRPNCPKDAHFRARFEREAELAATLDHPNIVTVYSRGETDGQLWIAMQYVAGSDADEEVAQGG